VEFVWFAGEERGRLGSQYHADHGPSADRIVAMLNLDMIGRNENDAPARSNTVNIIGSDRISTELHNINEEANARLPAPLTLDYDHNDVLNVRLHYFGSDHYTYALKGIPVIFFNTGRHPDYHQVTDSADRIDYLKAALITRLAYETAVRVANVDHAPVRDNRGVRVGKGRTGAIR
jgi:Zn-dependent M28 family amino/carboxypeptidase